jgi:predicted short-subunit dehydrogenase-like oxidoreductase (DUF2520 family)
MAHAQRLTHQLEERLTKAETALQALTPPVGRGKRQITEEGALQQAAQAVLSKHRVQGLLTYHVERQVEQEVKWVGRGRGGANRKLQVSERVRYQITAVSPNAEALAAQQASAPAGGPMPPMRQGSGYRSRKGCRNIGRSITSKTALLASKEPRSRLPRCLSNETTRWWG